MANHILTASVDIDPSVGEFVPNASGLYVPENEGLVVVKEELIEYAAIHERTYQPNGGVLTDIDDVHCVTITGPRGMGKDSVRLAMGYPRAVSLATRDIRAGEEDGKDYHFVKPAQYGHLIAAIRQGRLLQYSMGIAGDEIYGTVPSEYSHRQPTVIDVMYSQLESMRTLPFDRITSIYLVSPFSVWVERWRKRGKMSDDQIQKSFEEAAASLSWALNDEHIIFLTNTDIDATAKRARTIVERPSHYTQASRSTARSIGHKLLRDIHTETGIAA